MSSNQFAMAVHEPVGCCGLHYSIARPHVLGIDKCSVVVSVPQKSVCAPNGFAAALLPRLGRHVPMSLLQRLRPKRRDAAQEEGCESCSHYDKLISSESTLEWGSMGKKMTI